MSASFGGAFRSGDDRTELRGTFRKWVEAGRGSTLADGEVLAEVHRLTAERDQARHTAAVFEQRLAVLADLYSAAFAKSNLEEVDDDDAERVLNRAWCRLEYALGLGVLNSGDDEIAERLAGQAEAEGWFTDLAPLFRPQDES